MRELRHLASALANRSIWLALLVSLLLATLAYQLPFNFSLDLGTPQSAAYITNFYPPQTLEGRAARWSHAYSYIRLPGTGGNRPVRVTLDFNTSRKGASDPRPINMQAFVGGEQLFSAALPPATVWRTVTLDVDASHPAASAARDVVIELRTDVYRPPDYQGNELGLIVSNVMVEPLPGAGWQFVVPNVRTMILLALLVLVVYLIFSRLFALVSGNGRARASPLAANIPVFAAAVAGFLLALGIAQNPVGLSLVLQPLLVLAAVAYIVLLAAIYLLPPLTPALRQEVRAVGMAARYLPLSVLLAASLVAFSLAMQSPVSFTLDIGSGRDAPYLRDFNPPMFPMPDGSPGDYRFTSARSSIVIPGVGSGGVYSITMRLNPGENRTVHGPVRVLANGVVVANTQLVPGWQEVTFQASTGPASPLIASNLELEITAPAEVVEGGEQRGVLVDTVQIIQAGKAGAFSLSPPHELGLLVVIALLYLLVSRAWGTRPGLHTCRLALLAAALTALTAAYALYLQRIQVAVALPHVLTTLLATYLLLVLSSHLLSRFTLHASRPAHHATGLLAAIVASAFMLRYGFSALPQFNVIDLPYHLKWLKILIGGDFGALYFPGQLSSVPPEWSLDVLIPKSPLFYMAMWPLGLLRGLDLASSVLFATSLLDAAMVLAIYVLVVRLNVSWALWSAGLYAFMPLAFRSFAFGILPTIFAQALTLLALAIPILRPPLSHLNANGLRKYAAFAGWVLLLTASLIAFPTALAFNSFVIVLLAVGWLLWRAAPRGSALALVAGLIAALALSVALYYGLYVGPLLTKTLPALAQGTSIRGKELWPGGAAEMVGWTAGYVVNWLPLLLLPLALVMLWTMRGGPWPERRLLVRRVALLMLGWFLILLGGMLLNLRFDMIGKHLYYTMPAAALAGGLVLSRLWFMRSGRRFYPAALACIAGLSVAWLALAFMAGRI